MADIQTRWQPGALRADWRTEFGDLAAGDDLATAVVLSLFTDRRAEPDDGVPDGTDDRRGWWGDGLADRPLGSRLWLLSRAKATRETRLRAIEYAQEALAWLVDDGVADAVEVDAEWLDSPPSQLGLVVTVTPPAAAPEVFLFATFWRELAD